MKIDVSKIEGFDALSAEEKVAKLMEYEFDEPKPVDNSTEISKLKNALNKANAEAKEWKDSFRAKQTEQERAEAERAEAEKALQEELSSLRREKTLSEYAKSCMSMGYDAALATECAEAMADGRFSDVFAIQQRFLEAKIREAEATALNRQPSLSAGMPPVAAAEKAEENQYRSYFGLKPI